MSGVKKLYEIPPRTFIRVNGVPEIADEIIFFDHIDGMYSFCKNKEGQIVHLACWTPVEIVDTKEVPRNFREIFQQDQHS